MNRADTGEIISLAEKREAYFHELSDKVWSTPELFFEEKKSSETLINALKELGFQVETGVAGISTAFVGSYGSGKPGGRLL